MSFFDDASLAFLPSGAAGKDGKLYSIRPTDGSGDFTFSRGSNLAATRVDVNGLIEKGRENLLLQSNQFDTTWTTASASVTSGQGGYDGSNDAWLLDKSGSTGRIKQDINLSGVNAFSIYAKANTSSWVRLLINGAALAYFDLSTGSVGTTDVSGFIDAKIENVGNGWYRCSLIANGSSTLVNIVVADADGDTSGTSGNIYIQDSQLEIGLAATPYIESGATTGKAGLLEDEPRFDYSGGVTCPSLLLEPSRTQLIPQTEYLSGLSLGNSPTLTQNYAVSPEGVQNAVRVQDTDGSNFKTIQTQFSITSGSTYTISVYVKKATSPITTYGGFYFDFDGGTRKTSNLIFDEYNGTLVNASGNAITSVIHPVIDEGDYWRFSATATDTGSNTLLRPTLRAGASTNGTSVSLATKDYTAYGLQVEQGSYPTSYIPNHSGGTITRSGDLAITDSNTFDSLSTFTWFFEISRLGFSTDSTSAALTLRTSAGAEQIRCHFDFPTKLIRVRDAANGYTTIGASIDVNANTYYKICVISDGITMKIFVNGTQRGGDYTIVTQHDVDRIYMDGKGFDCKQLLLFPTALTDSECITLTTI